MFLRSVIIFATLCIGAVFLQVTSPGPCPTVEVQQNFNVSRYLGRWYEIEKFPVWYEDGRCVRAEYTLRESGSVNVYNRVYLDDGFLADITGEGTIPDPDEPAKLSVRFFDFAPPSPYWVLDTDYDNYVLVFACNEELEENSQTHYIMSRELTMPEETRLRLRELAESYGIDISNFAPTNQTDCPE